MANEQRRKRESWSTPRDDHHSHEYRHRDRRERSREETMQDWYGEECAPSEIEEHQPGERTIGELLAGAFREMNAGDYPVMRTIIENWREIMGAEFMQHAEPRRIDRGTLYVEVFQAAWLHRLRMFALPTIRDRVRQLTNNDIRDVRLVPGGKSSSRMGG